jgi:putative endonuclease
MTTKDLGDLGERLACEYLVDKQFNILEKNYQIPFGEIDIIAKKENIIHFVEVKTVAHLGDGFYPEERVDWKKQRKLRQMSQIWLQKHHYPLDCAYQIDVIGIVADHQTRLAKLHYFPNAVQG